MQQIQQLQQSSEANTLSHRHQQLLVSTSRYTDDTVQQLQQQGYYVWRTSSLSFALSEACILPTQPLRWPVKQHQLPLHILTPRMCRALVQTKPRSPPAAAIIPTNEVFEDRPVYQLHYMCDTSSQQLVLSPTQLPTFDSAIKIGNTTRCLLLGEGLDLLTNNRISQLLPTTLQRIAWPPQTDHFRPTSATPTFFALEAEASCATKQQLPTFSLRHEIPMSPQDLRLWPFPIVNTPPRTQPQLRNLREPRRVDVSELFNSPEWNAILAMAKSEADEFHYRTSAPQHRHRRRTQPLIISRERSLALTNGCIVDLRPCFGSDGTIVSTSAIELVPQRATSNLNIPFMRQQAQALGIQDEALFDELEFGFTNNSTTPCQTRIYPAHNGAYDHYDEVDKSIQHDCDQGWIQGPSQYPLIWPFVAAPRNAILQYKGNGKTSIRVTTDFSEMQSPDSINAGQDLDLEPDLHLIRIQDFLLAVAILVAIFPEANLWSLDIMKFYRQLLKAPEELWQQGILWRGQFWLDLRCVFGDRIMVHKSSRVANFFVKCLRVLRNRRHTDLVRQRSDKLPVAAYAFLQDRCKRLGIDQAELSFLTEYIDDQLGVAPTAIMAQDDLNEAVQFVQACGFPIQREKIVGPATTMDALGVTIHIPNRTATLSAKFISKLEYRTNAILHASTVPIKDLEKLVYSHAHVACFVPKAKDFASDSFRYYHASKHSRMVSLSNTFKELAHRFLTFAKSQPSIPLAPMLIFPARGHDKRIDIEMDASGDIGWGFIAFGSDPTASVFYAQGRWDRFEKDWPINEKELIVSLYATLMLGSKFNQFFVLEAIDNTVAQQVARTNKSSSLRLRTLQRARANAQRLYGWLSHQQRIASHDNDLADSLSRYDNIAFQDAVRRRGLTPEQLILLPPSQVARQTVKKDIIAGTQRQRELDKLAAAAILLSTRKSASNNRRAWHLFTEHCHHVEHCSTRLVPAGEFYTTSEREAHRRILLRFAMSLAQRFKSLATVQQYMSLVKGMHRRTYHRELMDGTPALLYTDAIKGLIEVFPIKIQQRVGILPQHITSMKSRLPWFSQKIINYTALIETAFCLLARSIELTARTQKDWMTQRTKITRADVTFEPTLHSPQRVIITITRAKQSRKNPHNITLPVTLKYNRSQPINAAFALQQLFLQDPVPTHTHATTPLFRVPKTNQSITQRQFLDTLRKFVGTVTQLPSKHIGTHSLRIGALTTAIHHKIPKEFIESFVGWSTDMTKVYNRRTIQDQLNFSDTLGNANPMETQEIDTLLRQAGLPLELAEPDGDE